MTKNGKTNKIIGSIIVGVVVLVAGKMIVFPSDVNSKGVEDNKELIQIETQERKEADNKIEENIDELEKNKVGSKEFVQFEARVQDNFDAVLREIQALHK